jgi:hypothetical protein
MSDKSISIVPKLSNYPNNKDKAKEILEWLVFLDIVKPQLSKCVLGSYYGYCISAGARNVINPLFELPFNQETNGLDIKTDRQIFDTAQNGLDELICPNCSNDNSTEDWNFFSEWNEGESNNLTCPICNKGIDVHKFKFNPEWGFSNLGFTFWNWPDFTQDFINDFRNKLDCDISVIYQHI